ncbi:gamma-glutamyltransferase [Mesorhizobium denitrificans]|nr:MULTISPECIES: gamma-glutamyltransferase [Mesorhizobium]
MLADSFASRERPVLVGRGGAISAADPFAAAAGQEILCRGGNAVEAMIAAQAVLAVVAPNACGLGGDMLCLIREPGGRTRAFNGTGAAPRKLTHVANDGGASITVPGIVGAWSTVLAAYGRLPLHTILQPAIKLARLKMPVTPSLMRALQDQRARLERNGAAQWQLLSARAGQLVTQEELAMTLDRIGKEGAHAFYSGVCAQAIVSAVQRQGGALDLDDLEAHETVVTEPISIDFKGMRLLVQPPVSQGVLLAMATKGLFELGEIPADRIDHAGIELTEASFAYRDQVVRGASLLDEKLQIDLNRAANRGGPRAYLHTAGVSVADRHGNCAASLVSVFDDFGSAVYVPECGFTLNNRAGGFTSKPNDAMPGKRPVHTLAPAILETPHGPLGLSTPGADGQVQTLLQVICGLTIEKLDLARVVGRPRWRSENGKLLIEKSHPQKENLAELGHKVVEMPDGDMRAGAVTAAGFIDGSPVAVADWRRTTWAGVV